MGQSHDRPIGQGARFANGGRIAFGGELGGIGSDVQI